MDQNIKKCAKTLYCRQRQFFFVALASADMNLRWVDKINIRELTVLITFPTLSREKHCWPRDIGID